MKKTKSKSEWVYQVLRKAITAGGIPAGSKLPSVQKLIRKLDVSRGTLFKAIDQLEQQGLVERFSRSGIYAKGKENLFQKMQASIEPAKPRALQIAEAISSQIAQGKIRTGDSLPMHKALQYEFRTSRETIATALHALEQRDLIHRNGYRFVAGGQDRGTRRQSGTGVFLVCDQNMLQGWLGSGRAEFLTSFEREVLRSGVSSVRIIDLSRESIGILSKTHRTSSIGALYFLNHGRFIGTKDEKRKKLENEVRVLASLNFPVVFIDHSTVRKHFPGTSVKGQNLYLLDLADETAGERLALQLAAFGHRSVAFFAFSSEDWCYARLAGLRQGLAKGTGKRAHVIEYMENFERWPLRKGIRFASLPAKLKQETAALASHAFSGFRFTCMDPAEPTLRNLFSLAIQDKCRISMAKHFRRELESSQATAWVFADPTVAAVGVEFLAQKAVRIPRDLAVATIENDSQTLLHRITTFDFEFSRLGYLAAHCLLKDIPVRRNRNGIVLAQGSVVDRGSVASLRNQGRTTFS